MEFIIKYPGVGFIHSIRLRQWHMAYQVMRTVNSAVNSCSKWSSWQFCNWASHNLSGMWSCVMIRSPGICVPSEPRSPWKAQGSILVLMAWAETGVVGRQSQFLELGRGRSSYFSLWPQSPSTMFALYSMHLSLWFCKLLKIPCEHPHPWCIPPTQSHPAL